MNIFESATKKKLRFPSSSGLLSTEDLWDLPLLGDKRNSVNLDDIAKNLNKKIKESEEDSFVKKPSSVNSDLKLQFDVVKHIIDVKIEEDAKRADAAAKRERNERIMEIIERKQDQELESKSLDELKSLLES